MKAYRKIVACAALMLAATVGVTAAGSELSPAESTEQVSATPKKARQSRLNKLTNELNLSQEQRDQVQAILREERSAVKVAYADTSLVGDVRKAKRKEIAAVYNARIRSVLTEAQQTAFDQSLNPKKRRSRG